VNSSQNLEYPSATVFKPAIRTPTRPFTTNDQLTHLISTQLLHDVHVLDAQLQPVHVLLQALLGILEIDVCPAADVPHASVGLRPDVGVGAAALRKERFVRSLLSHQDDDLRFVRRESIIELN
jgi:hypothetical protein